MPVNHLEKMQEKTIKYLKTLKKNIQTATLAKGQKLTPHQHKVRATVIEAQAEVIDVIIKDIPGIKEKVEYIR